MAYPGDFAERTPDTTAGPQATGRGHGLLLGYHRTSRGHPRRIDFRAVLPRLETGKLAREHQ